MKQNSFNFLMNAGSNIASAAASIFDAIEACNGMFENSDAKGMAAKFDLGLTVSKLERGLSYFKRFLNEEKIDRKLLKKVEVDDKTKY